jgi:hypothetical protein
VAQVRKSSFATAEVNREPSSGKALRLVSQGLLEMLLLDAADPRDLLGLCWTDFPGGDLWWGLPWFYSFALPRWAQTRGL